MAIRKVHNHVQPHTHTKALISDFTESDYIHSDASDELKLGSLSASRFYTLNASPLSMNELVSKNYVDSIITSFGSEAGYVWAGEEVVSTFFVYNQNEYPLTGQTFSTTAYYNGTTSTITSSITEIGNGAYAFRFTPDVVGRYAFNSKSASATVNGNFFSISSLTSAYTGIHSGSNNGVAYYTSASSISSDSDFRYNKDSNTITIVGEDASIVLSSSTGSILLSTKAGIQLFDDSTVYNDLRFPAIATTLGGLKDPSLAKIADNGAGSDGVYAYAFPFNLEKEILVLTQVPYNWKEHTDMNINIRWSPSTNDAGNVVWGIEYVWDNVNTVIGNTTIITASVSASTIANMHQQGFLGVLSGSGKNYSSILNCRVFRQTGNVEDTYSGDAYLLEFDFQYETDSLGSPHKYFTG